MARPGETAWLDPEQLQTQTGGDRLLEAEVLAMLREQCRLDQAEIARMEPEALREFGHKLKGSARALGAFALGEAAERLERAPSPEMSEALSRIARRTILAIDERLGGLADRETGPTPRLG